MINEKAPNGKILKKDVSIAKNYLNKNEVEALERVVSLYLEYAEDQALRKIPMTVKDWYSKIAKGFADVNLKNIE